LTTPGSPSTNELAAERTDLAARRTLMAADRTLMAWVRTALSMISFGFTIYKILEGFQQAGAPLPHSGTPRTVGLFLIGLGTLATAMGTVEYWGTFKELRVQYHYPVWRPSFIMALIMSSTGMFLFVSIVSRIL
jgi:putative membrane protein